MPHDPLEGALFRVQTFPTYHLGQQPEKKAAQPPLAIGCFIISSLQLLGTERRRPFSHGIYPAVPIRPWSSSHLPGWSKRCPSFALFIVQPTACQILCFSFQSLTPPYPLCFLSRKADWCGHYQRNPSPPYFLWSPANENSGQESRREAAGMGNSCKADVHSACPSLYIL